MNALRLGGRRYDITTRPLVMGVLGWAADDGNAPALDALLRRADRMLAEGADILDLGGVQAAPRPEVGEAGELDRLVPAVEAVAARFELPVSVHTSRAAVLDAACVAGAVCGHDTSGFADPDYLATAARHGAAVVATDIERARRAVAAGIPGESVMLDARLDQGTTVAQCAALVGAIPRLAAFGHPVLLSPAATPSLGMNLDDADERRWSSHTATAYGVVRGARIVRAHDVAGTVRIVRTVQALLEAAP